MSFTFFARNSAGLATRALATSVALAALSLSLPMVATPALAQGAALATVNGKPLSEADLKLAETELGPELAQLPPASRRRILLEYLIEN